MLPHRILIDERFLILQRFPNHYVPNRQAFCALLSLSHREPNLFAVGILGQHLNLWVLCPLSVQSLLFHLLFQVKSQVRRKLGLIPNLQPQCIH